MVNANETPRYVYMIRAGQVVKVGCSRNPIGRWKALKPFLSIYGKPEFAGYVEGDLNDEKRVYGMGEPFPDAEVREIRLGSTIPDLATIFPFRTVYYPDPEELSKPTPSPRPAFKQPKPPKEPKERKSIPRCAYPKANTFLTVEKLLAEDLLRNYTSIANEVGVTRERVRQIAMALGDSAAARREIRKDVKFHAQTGPPRGFAQIVKKWLKDCGYGYCGVSSHEGGRVLDYIPERRCRKCASVYASQWYRRNPEKVKAWNKSERGREVNNAAHKRYLERHPDVRAKAKERAAKRYREAMADPKKREALRAYYREVYRKRKERSRNA